MTPNTHLFFSPHNHPPNLLIRPWVCAKSVCMYVCVSVGHPVWMAGEYYAQSDWKSNAWTIKENALAFKSRLHPFDACRFISLALLPHTVVQRCFSTCLFACFLWTETSRYILFSITRALLVKWLLEALCCSIVHSRAEWYVPWGLSDGHKGSIQNGVQIFIGKPK